MKAKAAIPSPSYLKAPSIFCVWKWRTMNCHCVTPLMASALYQAGIWSNLSVPQPVLLGIFYFGCRDRGYGPSTNNSEKQHAWKYVPAYPGSLCQLEKQSIHQLLTRYTALVKKRSCHPGFCLNLHPGLLWHSRLIWIGTSFAELSDAALKKMGLFWLFFFFFVRLGPFIGNPSLLSKRCYSVLCLHAPKLHEKRSNIASFLLSLSRNTYKLRVGEKIKQSCWVFSSPQEYRTGIIGSKFSRKLWWGLVPLFA